MNQLRQRHQTWMFAFVVVLTSAGILADEPAAKVPEAVVEKFTTQDRDGDMQLSIEEFRVWYGAAQAAVALRDFDVFDRNADGNRIVFFMHCPERAVSQLYEFNPNSNDPPQLLQGQDPSTTNTGTCWTPDGKRLIVITGDY